ncbi:MAG: AAA family ATPase [Bacilli bacterium]|jgi:guanylate kinase|nr:AAA family ATPase [Bacilli bacterium]
MIILTGPSASGKTATCLYLQKHYGIKKVITHTTRPMREGEKNDVDYHFVSVPEFERLKKENYFIETVTFNGNFYGTSRPEVRIDKCMAVEFNGAKTYSALHDPRTVIFYMKLSEQLRLARMTKRGDDPEKIKSRLQNDRDAFEVDDTITRIVDCTVDTEQYDLPKAAKYVYDTYIAILKKRGIEFPPVEEAK